jgi:hypothetical protein
VSLNRACGEGEDEYDERAHASYYFILIGRGAPGGSRPGATLAECSTSPFSQSLHWRVEQRAGMEIFITVLYKNLMPWKT